MPPLVMGVLITIAVLETRASEEPDDGDLLTLPREAAGMSKKTVPDKVTVKT